MTSDTKSVKTNVNKGKNGKTITEKLSDSDIKKMSVKDREEMLNKMMDKGVKNLSEDDKKLLQRLAK